MITIHPLSNNTPASDPTEPRWTCAKGHSCAANVRTCTVPGCGSTG